MKHLDLDPTSEASLQTLRDSNKVPWESITSAAEELIPYGTFRGCTDGEFLPNDMMAYQASPEFASGLKSKGVKFLVVGDMRDEWYLYSIAHPITDWKSIGDNLRRYYPDAIVERILGHYGEAGMGLGKGKGKDVGREECEKMFGVMLSEGQGMFTFTLQCIVID